MPRVYKYVGPLDEVEVAEHGLIVKRGERVEVNGYIKHPDFEWVQPKKDSKPKKAAAPAPEAAPAVDEPAVAEENV